MRVFLPAILAAALHAQPADLVLRNGKIVTMNPAAPTAQAIAVRGDKITALGADRAAQQWIGPNTKVIDLHGMLAIPGFIEGHGHFTGVGEFRMGLDLREARTWDDIVAQVARAAKQAKPGEWIVGRGWHQSKWDKAPEPNVEGFPLHASLDKVSPDNPVLLTHASGHAAFVNGKALEVAGVTAQDAEPLGRRDPQGRQGQSHRPAARARPGPGRPRARRLRSQAHARRALAEILNRPSTWPSTSASPRASRPFRTPARRSPPSTC